MKLLRHYENFSRSMCSLVGLVVANRTHVILDCFEDKYERKILAGNYTFKVNNRNTKTKRGDGDQCSPSYRKLYCIL